MPEFLPIADKTTLDTVKGNTDTLKNDAVALKTDTATIKNLLGSGSTVANSIPAVTTDRVNMVVNLTGKYQLVALINNSADAIVNIQIDGSVNRISFHIGTYGIVNVTDWDIKSDSAMKITSDNVSTYAVYKLLP